MEATEIDFEDLDYGYFRGKFCIDGYLQSNDDEEQEEKSSLLDSYDLYGLTRADFF